MKQAIHAACAGILSERISSLKNQLGELVDGAKNDSKSTAGDKHETARAMMQIEQEKLTGQLNVLLTQQQALSRIDVLQNPEIVVPGSLVKTDNGLMYLSIPLGRISFNEEIVMCLSAQSPLGMMLVGKHKGDSVEFNGTVYRIEAVS